MTYQERTSLDSDLANFVDAIKSERSDLHHTWERFAPQNQRANPIIWASAIAALLFTVFVALDVLVPGMGHAVRLPF